MTKAWYANLFRKLPKQQLKSASVFCILDGVSFYEDPIRRQDFEALVEALAALVSDAQESNLIFKVLFTSPTRSRCVKKAAMSANEGSLEVLDVPPFIDIERTELREFHIHTPSRRSSINSVSNLSVYEDAMEYVED